MKNKHLKQRINFERDSQFDTISFSKADFAFEVSSEGELEQIYCLLESMLRQGLFIELIFFSPSLQKTAILLRERFSNLKIFAFPLLTYVDLNKLIKSKIIIFCRYDFFPQLILLSKNRKLILLNASLKGKKLEIKSFYHWFLKHTYSLFELIVCANNIELDHFYKYFSNKLIYNYDFRHKRIIERIKQTTFQLNKKATSSIIFGSFWMDDFFLFDELKLYLKQTQPSIVIVPHSLNAENINLIYKSFCDIAIECNLSCQKISSISIFNNKLEPAIYILNVSGVLCELYQYFDVAYIGGGFGASIHSVLEPFWSGCNILVGPNVARSSEFDYVQSVSSKRINIINSSKQFLEKLIEGTNHELNSLKNVKSLRESILLDYNDLYTRILNLENK